MSKVYKAATTIQHGLTDGTSVTLASGDALDLSQFDKEQLEALVEAGSVKVEETSKSVSAEPPAEPSKGATATPTAQKAESTPAATPTEKK